jgi:hypothetical protein
MSRTAKKRNRRAHRSPEQRAMRIVSPQWLKGESIERDFTDYLMDLYPHASFATMPVAYRTLAS